MTTTSDDGQEAAQRDRARIPSPGMLLALAVSAGLVVVWWRVTDPRPYVHIDHAAFLRTIAYQQEGANYYEAMRTAFHDIEVTIGHARGYRIPTAFLFWRWIPVDLLFGVFLVVVVGSTAALTSRLARNPLSVVAVTGYMLMAGRSLGGYEGVGVESWMLVELWLVPFALATVVAWRAERDWTAAAMALIATLLRETAAVLLMGGLLAAIVQRRARLPWLSAAGMAVALYLLHFWIASGYAEPPGNFARLFGTGQPPETIWRMIVWTLVGSPILAIGMWGLGGWGILRSRERWLLLPLLCMPLNGIIVDRPYWGIFLAPFLIVYGIDAATEPFSAPSARTEGGAGAGSTPPPRTRWRGRGTPEGALAPPSGSG